MGEDLDDVAVRIRCGTCTEIINVKWALVDQLKRAGCFRCPTCKGVQKVDQSLLDRQMIQSEQAARMAHLERLQQAVGNRILPNPVSNFQLNLNQHNLLGASSFEENAMGKRKLKHSFNSAEQPMKRMHVEGYPMDPIMNGVQVDEDAEEDDDDNQGAGETFQEYSPAKLAYGIPHPDPVVESSSLTAAEPPDIWYKPKIQDLIDRGSLSRLQLEAICYACQRHKSSFPNGESGGFFIGDGAGVGKGRTIAGLIVENWRCGRKRHLWISVSPDLKHDARRDLDDVHANDIALHALNKLPYGQLDSSKVGVRDGVLFLTYSTLISQTEKPPRQKRLNQILEWCGKDFEGLIVFDECHKAKNLVAECGTNATKTGLRVLEIQQHLPRAKVVYCSATGASELRNMAYMTRLGLWGEHHLFFKHFEVFMKTVGGWGVGALELVAMDIKSRGMYLCRTLSFKGAEFAVEDVQLDENMCQYYIRACKLWNGLLQEFLYAQQVADSNSPKKVQNRVWSHFWSAHQRFFRQMCMCAKVDRAVECAESALKENKCVVIGLQSTGEARIAELTKEKGTEMDDFASGLKETVHHLIQNHYPLPECATMTALEDAPNDEIMTNGLTKSDMEVIRQRASHQDEEEGGARNRRKAAKNVNYKEQALGGDTENGNGDGNDDDDEDDDEDDEDDDEDEEIDLVDSSEDEDFNADSEEENDGDSVIVLTEEETESPAKPKVANGTSEQKVNGNGIKKEAGTSNGEKVEDLVDLKMKEKQSEDARGRKEMLLKVVEKDWLPSNPLDLLIDKLGGPDKVAEMTGRRGRLVKSKDDDRVRWEARNASGVDGISLEAINVAECKNFMDGKKNIAIISDAASAGISLHADRRHKNQKRRVHITLELPWSADRAVQQFGRSHRSNQATAPQYKLLLTSLGGEKRFASAVARRLQNLGALTQGDRRAGPQFQEFNYDSAWGRRALQCVYQYVMEDVDSQITPRCAGPDRPYESISHFFEEMRRHMLDVGLITHTLNPQVLRDMARGDKAVPPSVGTISPHIQTDIPRFLNRLLGMVPTVQQHLFGFFEDVLEDIIKMARKMGKYDDGIVDLSARCLEIREPPETVYVDERTGGATLHFTVYMDRGIDYESATNLLLESKKNKDCDHGDGGFYRTRRPGIGGQYYVLLALQHSRDENTFRIYRPSTGQASRSWSLNQLNNKYIHIDQSLASTKKIWDELYQSSAIKGVRVRNVHILGGSVLPVWGIVDQSLTQLPKQRQHQLRIVRLQTTDSNKRLVGVRVPDEAMPIIKDKLRQLKMPQQPAAPANNGGGLNELNVNLGIDMAVGGSGGGGGGRVRRQWAESIIIDDD